MYKLYKAHRYECQYIVYNNNNNNNNNNNKNTIWKTQ